MIKIAGRFPHPVDHGGVPMQVITEFGPNLSIGGSMIAGVRSRWRSRLVRRLPRGNGQLENVSVYYAAIRSEGRGRWWHCPGCERRSSRTG